MNCIHSREEAGQLLGTLFFEFCCRLYWASSTYTPDRDALLFMARGGLRLQFLFEQFLQINKSNFPISCHPFWISRFAALKMTFSENPEWAVASVVREFCHANCQAMALALLPETQYPNKNRLMTTIPAELGCQPVTREHFFELYYHECPYSLTLRKHFDEQHEWGHAYLKKNFGSFARLHTIDTGWFGTTLGSLQTGCRDWQWDALYFGRWNYRDEQPWYFNDIVGLMIDAVGLSGKNPLDVLLEYHHLIEAPLEPEMPSVEYYTQEGKCNAEIPQWQSAVEGMNAGDLWDGVKKYFSIPHSTNLDDTVQASLRALRQLKKAVRYPSRDEALILKVPPRSADFGKNETTPVFYEYASNKNIVEYCMSIKRSLWPVGMIAVSGGRLIRLRQILWHVVAEFEKYRGAV